MDSSVPLNSHLIDGYKILRYDRPEKFKVKYNKPGNGGGIAVLFKENLIVEKYNGIKEDTEEILWVLVKGCKGLLVGTVYNTEYCELLKSKNENESIIEQHLREVTATGCDVCVLGDFNIDLFEKNKPKTKKLKTLFKNYGFSNKITSHTRVDSHSGRKSLLDHIWIRNSEKCLESGTVNGFGDLEPQMGNGTYITLNKKLEKAKTKKIKIRNFKKYDSERFNEELKERLDVTNIPDLLKDNLVNEATEKLTEILRDTLDKHAPIIEVIPGQKKKYVPWYNEELKKKLQYRKDLLADSLNHGKTLYKDRLKKATKEINLVKKLLKIDWIKKEIENYNGDVKKLWKLIHFLIGNQKTKDVTEPEDLNQEIADNHNKYFATIGHEIQKQLDIDLQQEASGNFDYPPFDFKNETISNICKLIDSIKKDVATGIDCIPAKILKDAKHTISPILCDIINKSYETKTFPNILKIASIKPIHKSGDKNNISNYRPISILPVLSKIFERSAAIQLVQYFEKNKTFNKNQHAYRPQHSTITCLFDIINYTHEQLDSKNFVSIVSLDLSKAFDTINYDLLLTKLKNLNLNQNSVDFLKSYLQNRKQFTKFSDFTSKEEDVISGVPQGSILGPLLFLCFVNDLPLAFENICKFSAYADDTQLIVSAKNLPELKSKIENVIQIAERWYCRNGMKNNAGKSEVILISKKPIKTQKFTVLENDTPKIVETKKSIEILGVIIDQTLSWTKQINIMKKNAIDTIRKVHRINRFIPRKLRLTLYKTLISPKFNYADIIWGGCRKKDSLKLQYAQNFAIRSIAGKHKYCSAKETLKELKLLNLENRRKIHESVFLHKSMLGKTTKAIEETFKKHLPKLNTRRSSQQKFNLPRHNFSKFKKSPIYRSMETWNKLPKNLSFGNIKKHKSEVQNYLLEEQLKIPPTKNNYTKTLNANK